MNLKKTLLALSLASAFSASSTALAATDSSTTVSLSIAPRLSLVVSNAIAVTDNSTTAINYCVESNHGGNAAITVTGTSGTNFQLTGGTYGDTIAYTLDGKSVKSDLKLTVAHTNLQTTCNDETTGGLSVNLVVAQGATTGKAADDYSETLTFTVATI